MSRVFVAVTAAGAAVIHGAAALTTADWGVGAVLAMAGAAELAIAVGAAFSARWLPAPRTVALILVTPVLLWATLLLVAVTADSPALASSLATVPLAGASVLGLAGVAFAGADARRTRVGARVRRYGRGAIARPMPGSASAMKRRTSSSTMMSLGRNGRTRCSPSSERMRLRAT